MLCKTEEIYLCLASNRINGPLGLEVTLSYNHIIHESFYLITPTI